MENYYDKFVKKFDLDYDEVVDVVLSGKEPENKVLIMDLKGLQVLNLFGSYNAIKNIMKETLGNDFQMALLGKDQDVFGAKVKIKLSNVLLAYAREYEMPDDLFQEMYNVIHDGIVCSLYKEHNVLHVIGVPLEELLPAA